MQNKTLLEWWFSCTKSSADYAFLKKMFHWTSSRMYKSKRSGVNKNLMPLPINLSTVKRELFFAKRRGHMLYHHPKATHIIQSNGKISCYPHAHPWFTTPHKRVKISSFPFLEIKIMFRYNSKCSSRFLFSRNFNRYWISV